MDNDFDKRFNQIFNNFWKIWIASAVVGLIVLSVGVWAIIALVLHFT